MQVAQQRQQDQYIELFKICSIDTFLSQPLKYLLVFMFFQLNMLIYFLVTISESNLPLKIITILFYSIITLLELIFPYIDPGIIPKISLIAKNKGKIPLNIQELKQNRNDYIVRKSSFAIKSHSLQVKFCSNCSIYRPSRTMHCYTCGVCIQKLDHHCPWLGACIGKRNYYVYLIYIFCMQTIIGLMLYQASYFLILRTFNRNEVEYIFNLILIITCIPTSLFLLALIMIHAKLSKENLTTNQLLNQRWQIKSGNPYEKTLFLKNWVQICQGVYQSKYHLQNRLAHATQDLDINHIKIQMGQRLRNKSEDSLYAEIVIKTNRTLP